MGKGGGSQPTSTTAYQTNLPEYAKPYVMNMLGAAQNQLFTTSPGTTNAEGVTTPGEITGFKPYSPYSNDPTQYFAGPSSLQRGVYNEAGQMQTPGAYGQAQGLAGMSGMGQLGTAQQAGMYGQQGAGLGQLGMMSAMPAFGAGQQFRQGITDPSTMAQYMSPYQQQVTDVAKMNAVREAQIAGNQANLGAARQGTYGGARQALAGAERERNLLSNLSNIQTQGSQSAYDRALAQQQFGANLGLQGITTGLQGISAGQQGVSQGLQGVGAQQAGYSGAGQAASTLGQLGGAQQQADLARLGFQQQTGKEQQAYQQNIINQQIQDYATQQQYPFMQLSTMSNLLRGLPMQGMTTQQYQAQPSTTQQLLGLAGTGASLYGAMKREGGTIKEYATGGTIRGLENKIDDIGDAGGAKGLKALLAQTKSPAAKELIMERMREEGIAAANTGGLMTNMAGGGIIAFDEGGDVKHFFDEGAVKDPEMTDEERAEYIKNNEYLQRSRALANLPETASNFLSKYNPVTGSAYTGAVSNFFNASPEEQAVGFKKASDARQNKRGMFSSSEEEQKKDDRDIAAAKVEADVRKKTEAAKAKQAKTTYKFDPDAIDREEAGLGAALRANQPKPKPDALPPAAPPAAETKLTGIAAQLAEQDRLLAERGAGPGMGEETRNLMDYIKEGKQRRMSEAGQDRYLRMAEAFGRFGSTAGPMLSVASESLGGFAKGEGVARKELRAAEAAEKKIASDIEKGQRAEARGDFATAQKAYDSAADRENRLQISNRPGEFEKMYGVFAEGEKAAGRKPSFESFRKAYSGADEDLVRLTKSELAIKMLKEDTTPGGYMQLAASKKPEDKQKAAEMLAAVYRRYGVDPTTGAVTGSQTASAGGGNKLKFDASGNQV
jgi:hypothetical protein